MSPRFPCAALLGLVLAGVPARSAPPFAVEADFRAGIGPNASALALGGKLLVVANSDTADLSLLPLDGSPDRPPVPVGKVPLALALSADGATAYAACFSGQAVAFVDLAAGVRTRLVEVGVHPYDLVRVGGTLVVSGYYQGEVVALDAASGAITGRLALAPGLHRVLAHPDGSRVYVLNTGRDVLYEVGLAPLRRLREIDDPLGGLGAWDMVLSKDAGRIVISQWVGNRVVVVDTAAMAVRGTVETGGEGACALDLAPDGRTAVIAHSESDDAAVVDIERMNLRAKVPVGRFPFSAVRCTADGRHALVTVDQGRGVAVLDLAAMANLGVVRTGRTPHVLTPGAAGRFYVSNTDEGTVSVLRPTGRRERAFEALHQVE